MCEYNILKICENKQLKAQAASWFHEKWGVPREVYEESMEECIYTDNVEYVVKKKE